MSALPFPPLLLPATHVGSNVRGLVFKVTGTPLLFPGGTRPAGALHTRSFGLTHLVAWPGDTALARGPRLSQQLGAGPAE